MTSAMSSQQLIKINNNSFEQEVLHGSTPVLVVFGSPNQPIIKSMLADLRELSQNGLYKDQLKITIAAPACTEQILKRYQITHTPTLLLFKKKEGGNIPVSEILVGKKTAKQLIEYLQRNHFNSAI